MTSLTTRGAIDPERCAELQQFVANQQITEQVFRTLDALNLQIADVVFMDEFTIDLIVPLPDGLTLVYDTT